MHVALRRRIETPLVVVVTHEGQTPDPRWRGHGSGEAAEGHDRLQATLMDMGYATRPVASLCVFRR
jgi:hypothetical protein